MVGTRWGRVIGDNTTGVSKGQFGRALGSRSGAVGSHWVCLAREGLRIIYFFFFLNSSGTLANRLERDKSRNRKTR